MNNFSTRVIERLDRIKLIPEATNPLYITAGPMSMKTNNYTL